MLLSLTLTRPPARDLGFLLHKHPDKVQAFPLSFGVAHVLYPEASDERCTASLIVDMDPIALVRGRTGGEGVTDQYVNDRPYVASSLLSVALAQVYATALGGRCAARPDLVDVALPLAARIGAVAADGGPEEIRRLFEPLGYGVDMEGAPLDPQFPEWGEGRCYAVALEGVVPLHRLLNHLYVLMPVLDNDKHYYIGEDEVEKLMRHGADWLPAHPERDFITRRYLKRSRRLVQSAVERLAATSGDGTRLEEDSPEEAMPSLHEMRLSAVVSELKRAGARRVLDLGCGEGRLLERLLRDAAFTEIVGMDVAGAALERAGRRLNLDRLPARQAERLRLLHGSLTYRDRRLEGFDGAAIVEVIEHLDAWRLPNFERVVFECARPGVVVLTTPNAEYNRLFPGLGDGGLRHPDHRFEWTRTEFQAWAAGMAERFGYTVRIEGLGPSDASAGAPTQMGVFTRRDD
jgi:3' terminal RNA ribose 2'-O-methyltransferase Hen1